MASTAYSRRKGSSFEKDVAFYFAGKLEDDRIERRTKNGAKDRGDITGLRVKGERAVIECKNTTRLSLPAWIREAETEAGNDDAPYWAVVHKRTGVGVKNMGQTYVTMTLDQYIKLIS